MAGCHKTDRHKADRHEADCHEADRHEIDRHKTDSHKTVRVQNSSAVLVHFTLKLQDGSTAESTRNNGKPALFRLGDGSLSAELEQQLLDLQVGDKRAFTLAPESAFGMQSPDLIQFFSRRDFIETGIPDAGTIMLFTAMDGSEMPGVVREVTEDSITVDFNHPLAGQAVSFDIEVLEIDPSLEENHANIAG
jgi:FKBP-type peptidyl-prolyl cis-trans isomerase SlpA